jgi:hypothetical protein
MGFMQKDLARLTDRPQSSMSFLARRLGVPPDDGSDYSLAGAAGLLAAEELRQRGLSFALAGSAGRALREEVGALIADPARESWLMLDHDGDGEAHARIAANAGELVDHVQEDDIVLKCRPLAERALAAIRDAKKVKREVAN